MLHVFAVENLAIALDRGRDDERVVPCNLVALCSRSASKNSPDDEGTVIIGSKTLKKYNSSSETVIVALNCRRLTFMNSCTTW
jgi:hypothetical protein